jgi:hypothetical protein
MPVSHCRVSNGDHAPGRSLVPILIDRSAIRNILDENGASRIAQPALNRDNATSRELTLPSRRHGSFVEAHDRFHIVAAGKIRQTPNARPKRGTQAHQARLGARDELVHRSIARAKVIRPESLLCQQDRHHLRMRQAAIQRLDAIDADRQQPTASMLENGSAERTARARLDVAAGQGDDEPFALQR